MQFTNIKMVNSFNNRSRTHSVFGEINIDDMAILITVFLNTAFLHCISLQKKNKIKNKLYFTNKRMNVVGMTDHFFSSMDILVEP